MTFIVFGPGIRDNMPLDNLFAHKVVAQTQPVIAVREEGDEKSKQARSVKRQYEHQHAKQAYQTTNETKPDGRAELQARQIMSTPVTSLSPSASIADAWLMFREHRFRHFPVLTHEGKLIGIISDRDLLHYTAEQSDSAKNRASSIREVMKTRVLAASVDVEVRQIARIMFEQHIGAMPIVDNNESLVGIITRSDILHMLVSKAALEAWV
jgi:acetoin utilization protein AcuB